MDGKNFRDLKVWQLGMQLAEEVYHLSQQFPKHETYGLGSQIQRAAVFSSRQYRGRTRDWVNEGFRRVSWESPKVRLQSWKPI